MEFVKIYSSITRSTIWDESPETCKLWVTMLAVADRDGYVGASLPGLAREARLTIDQAQECLARLESPDAYSRSKEQDGRRVEKTDGGWLIINFRKYLEKRSPEDRREADRQRKRAARAASDLSAVSDLSASVRSVRPCPESPLGEERRVEEKEKQQLTLEKEPEKPKKASKEKPPPVITETHKRLGAAWEREQRETWGISAGAVLTVRKHREALDAAAHDRTEEEAEEVVRAYVRLPDPFLRQRGHPLSLLAANLPAALVALRGDTGSGIDPTWKIPPRLT